MQKQKAEWEAKETKALDTAPSALRLRFGGEPKMCGNVLETCADIYPVVVLTWVVPQLDIGV
jgi:hypothetical protein